MTDKRCYTCGSDQFVDNHHYDCRRGQLSSETVPLCRRCHQTYHIWGVGAFSPDTTEKALEVENKRREILRSLSPDNPLYGKLQFSIQEAQAPLTLEGVKRSSYWYKKHGIKRPSLTSSKQEKALPPLRLPAGEPLCGWDWVNEHIYDLIDWVPRIEVTGPGIHLALDVDSKGKLNDAVTILKGLKEDNGEL